MIAYLKGQVLAQDPLEVIIQTSSGVGYAVKCASVFELGAQTELFIEHVVREDSSTLFGFSTLEEKKLFQLLTSVNGVGPKTAFSIVVSIPGPMLSKAIIIEDISIFKSVSGVGPKTAKQIVLQLKDKMEKNYSSRSSSIKASSLKPSITTPEQESVLALESLGFSPMEARLKVEKILTKYPEIMVEDIVKRALSEKQ